jgi:2-polyprenyl-3-methyl-5-hydroxy-6-metoxy-1,4-benzoquinol methylase
LLRTIEERSRTIEYQANQSLFAAIYQVNLLQKWYVESIRSNFLIIDAPAVVEPPSIRLETSHPIALMSNDHLVPDSTSEGLVRPTTFVTHCMDILGKDIRCLDLGVGAAGLVFEYIANGLTAVGIDGSDYCRKNRIGYWPVLPNNLYTCDITHPFCFKWPDQSRVCFDLITMWEVLEHISENNLNALLKNVKEHLGKYGYFIGSISLIEYLDESGIPYHVTLKNKPWWSDKFQENGMLIVDDHPFNLSFFCRGNGPRFQDFHNYQKYPDSGFHFVAKLI